MRIIISPAKKMKPDPDSLPWQEFPVFLPQTEQIAAKLQTMTPEELKQLWKCNDGIAAVNVERLHNLDLRKGLTPAVLAYEGIQYQYMAPTVFTDLELAYIREHLRILSGFYGILRPFDGVTPYRLEMQAKLSLNGRKDLYEFWGSRLADALTAETDCIINLASKEYSLAVSRHLPDTVRMVTCLFCEEKNGKLAEKGTLCKMARGEMVRYMAEQGITEPEQLRSFDRLFFRLDEVHTTANTLVFVRKGTKSTGIREVRYE